MRVPILHSLRAAPGSRRRWPTVLIAFGVVLATLTMAPAPAAADHASGFYLFWIRCQDQNESFSDEPYVKVNGVVVREFTNVDATETHPFFFQDPVPFDFSAPWNGNYAEIQMWESDNPWSADDYLGTRYIYHDSGSGELYFFSSQGEYILAFSVVQ